MSTLEIQLFGVLSLHRDGQPLPRFPSKRVKDLLSYLLLKRDVLHPREYLAGVLWGELDDHKARHCLNTALWRLHQVLRQSETKTAPYLRVDAQSIGFNTDCDFRLDVAEFETRCAWAEQIGPHSPERQAELYSEAIASYQADLLVDCYEDWCLVERERLQYLYLRALGRLLASHSARHEFDAAVDYALRILACDPLREEVHRDLIQAYLDARQPAAALRQYRLCEDVLRRELGVSPMPETQSLLAQMVEPPEVVRCQVDSQYRGTAPAGDLAHELTAALDRLREAMTIFDQVRTEIAQTTTQVEEIKRKLIESATPYRQ